MEEAKYIKSEIKEGMIIFCAGGEIDLYTSPAIREELNKGVEEKQKKILISFKDVSYIDSSGLATLVEFYQNVKKWGADIILVDMKDPVRSVFELSRLDKIFTILPTFQEGISAFSGK